VVQRNWRPAARSRLPANVIIYGLNPVLEALRAGRAKRVRLAQRHDRRVQQVLQLAAEARVPVEHVDARELERVSRGRLHQGVVAEVDDLTDYSVADLVAGAKAAPLLVVIDGVEDPHNFGAIVRVADAAAVDGIVRQARRSASLDGAAVRASAGALAHVKIATVVNIARALEELKEAGIWTVGLAGEADRRYSELDLRLPTALVVGAEGSGLRRLVRERCDVLASIPMRGHVDSLNVSVATGVVLFEAVRQRSWAPPAG
jgi:23S rRNA (guanosine2251-2'-O)-methyltransferase